MVVRRKSNVAGLWLNTASATFDNVPSYYAVASTRPIDEIAPEEFRALHGIGLSTSSTRRPSARAIRSPTRTSRNTATP